MEMINIKFTLNLDNLNQKKAYARHKLNINNNSIDVTYECGSLASDKFIRIKNIRIDGSRCKNVILTFWSPSILYQNDIYIEDKTGKSLDINIVIKQFDFSVSSITIDDKVYFPLNKPDEYRTQVFHLL
jgi:hypothetical protein